MRIPSPSSRACGLGPWFVLTLFFVSQSNAFPCSASGTSGLLGFLGPPRGGARRRRARPSLGHAPFSREAASRLPWGAALRAAVWTRISVRLGQDLCPDRRPRVRCEWGRNARAALPAWLASPCGQGGCLIHSVNWASLLLTRTTDLALPSSDAFVGLGCLELGRGCRCACAFVGLLRGGCRVSSTSAGVP